MPGSAFNGEFKIADGALQEVRGPLGEADMTAISIRIVQRDMNGTGGMAAAAGKPRVDVSPELSRTWELPADGLLNAGMFVEGPAQASAVAMVLEDDGPERIIEWSTEVQLIH